MKISKKNLFFYLRFIRLIRSAKLNENEFKKLFEVLLTDLMMVLYKNAQMESVLVQLLVKLVCEVGPQCVIFVTASSRFYCSPRCKLTQHIMC